MKYIILFMFLILPVIAIAETDDEKIDDDNMDIKVFYFKMPGKVDYFNYIVDKGNNLCFASTWYQSGNAGGAGITTIPCKGLIGMKEVAQFLGMENVSTLNAQKEEAPQPEKAPTEEKSDEKKPASRDKASE